MNYRLLEKLDEGGFGEVWKAAADDGTIVAVKKLRDFGNFDARHRFEREVRILLNLRHAAIVQVIAYNISCEEPYYVMPLMKHGSIKAWVGKLGANALRGLARRIIATAAYLHRRGGLYRDFKPDNILVDDMNGVRLGDFGLGNDPRCTVIYTAQAVGTPGYIAPELFEGAFASKASDMFSIGATLYHLATGIHPDKTQSFDIWLVRKGLPKDLRDLILELTAADPRQRPSAEHLEWANELQEDEPVDLPDKPMTATQKAGAGMRKTQKRSATIWREELWPTLTELSSLNR